MRWNDKLKQLPHTMKQLLRSLRQQKELGKTLLLCLLIGTLLLQGGMLYHRATDDGIRSRQDNATQLSQVESRIAAYPIRFAIRNEEGIYGLEYNADGMQEVFETSAAVWAQAWSNAGTPQRIDAEEYRNELARRELILMEYDGNVPLQLAAGWVGSTVNETLKDAVLGTIVLCRNRDGSFRLYLHNHTDDTIVSIPTSVETVEFDTVLGQFEPNDCKLAANEQDRAVSADSLYFPGGETFEVISFADYTGGAGIEELLTAFHMDAQTAMQSAYTVEQMQVYVSGEDILRLTETGILSYDGRGIFITAANNANRRLQYVQCGYTIAQQALEALGNGASAVLTNAYFDTATGKYIAVFAMQIGGVPVDNTDTGYFARFEFDGTALCHADMALRSIQTTGETIAVMPERQVAASLNGASQAMLSLRYVDQPTLNRKRNGGTNGLLDSGSLSGYENNASGLLDSGSAFSDSDDLIENDTAWDDISVLEDGPLPEYATAWYDNTGTAISPQWYLLRCGDPKNLPDLSHMPETIEVVRADFDRMIRGGDAR